MVQGKSQDIACNAFHTFITDNFQELENIFNFQVDFQMFCTLKHCVKSACIRSFSGSYCLYCVSGPKCVKCQVQNIVHQENYLLDIHKCTIFRKGLQQGAVRGLGSSREEIVSRRAFVEFIVVTFFFFLSGFSFTTIHESRDCKGKGREFP